MYVKNKWLRFSLCCIAGAVFTGCNPGTEQTENSEVFEYDSIPASNTTPTRLNAFIARTDAPACSKIPSQADVNNGQWSYTDHFFTAAQAIKLGIPVVNINGTHDLKLYVKDYRRAAICKGVDSVAVLYGQIIRTVIEIEDYDATVGVDLASLAAHGTLKRNSQHFYFYKDGFYNPRIDSIIVTVQGKEFDVQNYSLFQGVMGEMINLLRHPGTTFSPSRIGVVEKLNEGDELLSASPFVAYAIAAVCNGNSCEKAKNRFRANRYATEIIERTYQALGCNSPTEKPSPESILKAKKILQGIKIKN